MAARSPSNTCTLTPAERAVSDQPTSSLARGFRCNADIHPAFATPFTSCRFNVSHCRLRGAPNGPLTHPMHRLHTQRTAHTPNAPLTHPTHHSHPQCTTHTPNAPLTHPMHHSHTQCTTHTPNAPLTSNALQRGKPGWLSAAVVNVCSSRTGIGVLRGISTAMIPPAVSIPSDSGVTSTSTMSAGVLFCQSGVWWRRVLRKWRW